MRTSELSRNDPIAAKSGEHRCGGALDCAWFFDPLETLFLFYSEHRQLPAALRAFIDMVRAPKSAKGGRSLKSTFRKIEDHEQAQDLLHKRRDDFNQNKELQVFHDASPKFSVILRSQNILEIVRTTFQRCADSRVIRILLSPGRQMPS
jgi:hypothetical protein